jgi:hypothetical protein
LHAPEEKTAITLVGSGQVRIDGVAGSDGTIVADRFSFSVDTCAFTLGGDVRIPTHDGVVKLRACTINRAGEIGERRSLIDDFRQNVDTDYRLELLPKIAATYEDSELPSDVRFMLALHLLRPHLSWHAPNLPPTSKERDVVNRVRDEVNKIETGGPWQPALSGEYWMLPDIPEAMLDRFRNTLREASKHDSPEQGERLAKGANREAFFWRIRDRQHADVARALRLLDGIADGDLANKAKHWAEEIRRNNTVLTLDVTGSYGARQEAPILLDARNADELTVEVYRAAAAEELIWVAERIGTDFIFRDHSLQYVQDDQRRSHEIEKIARDVQRVSRLRRDVLGPLPPSLRGEPVCRCVGGLAPLGVYRYFSIAMRNDSADTNMMTRNPRILAMIAVNSALACGRTIDQNGVN